MAKKTKAIHFEHQFRQTYDIWSDLTNTQLESVEGVTVSENFGSYRKIEIDMRYKAKEVLRELEDLANEKGS